MSIISRIIIGLMLVLSILALILGNMLYSQRETIKGQTQRLQKGIIDVAKNIESEVAANRTEKNLPKINIKLDQLKQYYVLDAAGKPVLDANGLPNTKDAPMEATLTNLAGWAAVQNSTLEDTRDELKRTIDKLAAAEAKLRETEQALTEARQTVKTQEEKIAGLERTVAEQKENIQQVTEQKEGLEQKINEKEKQIAKLQDANIEMEAKVKDYKRQVEKLAKDLDTCRRGEDGQNIPAGYQGKVIVVNTNYNFIILDLPAKSMLVPNVNLTIQRDNLLVGKVRVNDVKPDERFAIADILPDWQQVTADGQKIVVGIGDTVFY